MLRQCPETRGNCKNSQVELPVFNIVAGIVVAVGTHRPQIIVIGWIISPGAGVTQIVSPAINDLSTYDIKCFARQIGIQGVQVYVAPITVERGKNNVVSGPAG